MVLVDVETGEELHRLVGQRLGVHEAAFSPDRRYLLTGSMEYAQAIDQLMDERIRELGARIRQEEKARAPA